VMVGVSSSVNSRRLMAGQHSRWARYACWGALARPQLHCRLTCPAIFTEAHCMVPCPALPCPAPLCPTPPLTNLPCPSPKPLCSNPAVQRRAASALSPPQVALVGHTHTCYYLHLLCALASRQEVTALSGEVAPRAGRWG